MSATITDNLKKHVAELLLNKVLDATDSDHYYIGIGKGDQYDSSDTVPTAYNTISEERIARANLQSVKKLNTLGASYVIPRYNWTSGTIYSAYDDTVVGIPTNSFYVLTESLEVYVCIKQAKNSLGVATPSIVQPNYVTHNAGNILTTFRTSDGYTWKYLYTVTNTRSTAYLSANYIPIQHVDDSSGAYTGYDRDQALVKEAAISGQILGIAITSGGAGYTSAPSVVIKGNGSSAAATATIAGGTVVKIEMNNESAALGSGYDFASIEFTGGSPSIGASARAIIGPTKGLGYDVRDTLKANSIMLTSKPAGAEGGDFLVDQDFRQITLLKNIENKDGSGKFTADTGKALRSIRLTSTPDTNYFTPDTLITGSSATAYIDEVIGNDIFYHQNASSGFGTFSNGETITVPGSSAVVLNAIDSGGRGAEVDAFSGDILYIENRAAIVRSSAQTEDIKIVLAF